MLFIVEVGDKCSCLSGVSMIQVVGTVVRNVTTLTALEAKTLHAGLVNVPSIGVGFTRR